MMAVVYRKYGSPDVLRCFVVCKLFVENWPGTSGWVFNYCGRPYLPTLKKAAAAFREF